MTDPNHMPVEDWVEVHYAHNGRELRAVYCSCGYDDFEECPDRERDEEL